MQSHESSPRNLDERDRLRSLIEICNKYAAKANAAGADAISLFRELDQELLAAAPVPLTTSISMKEATLGAIEAIQELYDRKGAFVELSTGFPEIDKIIGGLSNAGLVVIAAAPLTGKTTLAINITEHIALELKKPVVFFTGQIDAKQFAERLLYSRAMLDQTRVRETRLMKADFPALQCAGSEISASPIFVEPIRDRTPRELCETARRLHKEHKSAAIFVDGPQALRPDDILERDRPEIALSILLKNLRALARECDVPVVVTASLKLLPTTPNSQNKLEHDLATLPEFGIYEKEADIVAILLRDQAQFVDHAGTVQCNGTATLNVVRHRNGPTGSVALWFIEEFLRFQPGVRF